MTSPVIENGNVCSALKNDLQASLCQFGYRRDFASYNDIPAGAPPRQIYSAPVTDTTRYCSVQLVYLLATDSTNNTTYREYYVTWSCTGPTATPGIVSSIFVNTGSAGTMVLNFTLTSTAGTSTFPPVMAIAVTHGTGLAFQILYWVQSTDTGPNDYIAPSSNYPLGVISKSYYDDMNRGLCSLGTSRYYNFKYTYDGTMTPRTAMSVPFSGTVNGSGLVCLCIIRTIWTSVDNTGRTFGEVRTSFLSVTGRGLPVILLQIVPLGGGTLPVTVSLSVTAGNASTAPLFNLILTNTAPGVVGTANFIVHCSDLYPNPYANSFLI